MRDPSTVQAFFFLAWIYVILFLEANSYSWNELQEAMVHSCTRAVSPIFFLLCAGAMTGIWNLSGTIPGLTYTGILWIRPEWYPVTAYAGCFLFSFLTGSVFSSCGTMGILFLNIGTSMGYEVENSSSCYNSRSILRLWDFSDVGFCEFTFIQC